MDEVAIIIWKLRELVQKRTSFAENAKFIPKWDVHGHQRSKVSCKISHKNVPASMPIFY